MTECRFCRSPAVCTLIEDNCEERDIPLCARCVASYDVGAADLAEKIAEERKRLSN